MAKLSKQQKLFFNLLRANHGKTISEQLILATTGWNPKAWRVYRTGRRFAKYLSESGDDLFLVDLPSDVSENDFRCEVTQSKTASLEVGGLAAPGKRNAINDWVTSLEDTPRKIRKTAPKYSIEREPLGTGGFATVHRAHDNKKRERVAIKISRPDPEARARIRREIEQQKRITHTNVMAILSEAPDGAWFTMPLARGDLYTLRTTLSVQERLQAVRTVAVALDTAHQLGLVHRDVTPRNILLVEVSGTPTWMLADWGLVRKPHGSTTALHTEAGKRLGTPAFMAPEMWTDAHDADVSGDVYGIGRVLAWCVQPGETTALIPNIAVSVPAVWQSLVDDATHSDREKRIQDVPTFLTRFDDVLCEISAKEKKT